MTLTFFPFYLGNWTDILFTQEVNNKNGVLQFQKTLKIHHKVSTLDEQRDDVHTCRSKCILIKSKDYVKDHIIAHNELQIVLFFTTHALYFLLSSLPSPSAWV